MAVFSSWRDEISLSEVVTDNLNSKKDKKITGDGVNNKKLIKVFPNSSEEVKEQVASGPSDREADAKTQQLKQRERRINLAKRQILQKKMQAVRAGANADITASYEPENEMVDEAKVDAGKSPEEKEKDRNVRKFGVSHSVVAHGKLRRALHRSDRGDKRLKVIRHSG